ncbi:putative legumain protein [Helianthus annuus]|nr:putative legumain protein [Helianthus annuus]KAJ0602761.1 putative legumain protein [Helianthus annuus]KAJ0937528.1 putative legumain protein [Helianthus annuus]
MANWNIVFQLKLLLLIVFVVQYSKATRPSLFHPFGSTNEPQESSTTWAVLVAGSNGYENYRHQADVCHAYQILKRGGLKDENIIVFMYDDIANDPNNPYPGVIINRPNGSDVYAGVPKDYTGESVTADNFFAVLLGNATAVKGGSGKVVASQPDDKIFVYFTDHGGPGVLCNQVIYVEACESGSIFEGLLPADLNIYVTTASNANESSYAAYCDGFNTCLGDLYSISWMEDSDSEDLRVETLEQQYLKVKIRTYDNHSSEGSHVMQYGTLGISKETVSVYQGSTPKKSSPHTLQSSDSMDVVNQRDADLYSMWQMHKKLTEGSQQKEELFKKIKEITAHRTHLDSSVDMIKGYLLGNEQALARDEGSALVDDWGCLKLMVRTFEKYCGSLTQYGMKHTRTFADLCNNGVTSIAMDTATKHTCSSYKMGRWNPALVGYSA